MYETIEHQDYAAPRLEDMPDFLTAEQLATLLQVSMNTARSLLQSGGIPAIEVRCSWRIGKVQPMAHLAQSCQGCN